MPFKNIFYVDSDPNGNVSVERPALAYSKNGSVWEKTGQGNSSSGWIQIISESDDEPRVVQ